jgi:hypothetical protein
MVVVSADLPWRTLIVQATTGRTLACLDGRATDRSNLYVLNGPASATGQVAADDPMVNIGFPNADDPAVLANNRRMLFQLQREQGADPPWQPRFGGIVTVMDDQGADAPTTRYTAHDPWQYLMSRPVRNPSTGALVADNGLTFNAGTLASDIAHDLLEITDTLDGDTHIDFSDTGLIEASAPLDEPITFDVGISVGEAWQQLCDTGSIDIHLDPIYDPDARPTKCVELRIVAQTTGQSTGTVRFNAVMGWDIAGNSVMEISRLIDGTRLANSVQFYPGQGSFTVPLQTDAGSIAAYGTYWAQQTFPEAGNKRVLIALAALAQVVLRRNGAKNISFSPAPERTLIPLRDYALGDYVPIWASRNFRDPLAVDYDSFNPDFPGACGYQRILSIPIDIDDNGVARVPGVVTQNELEGGA